MTPSFPLRRNPLQSVPANLDSSTCLRIFDDFPDDQAWALEVHAKATALAPQKDYEQVLQLLTLETGAPFGPFNAESYRVSRAFGVVTPGARTDPPPSEGSLLGAGIAQGLCYATWKHVNGDSFLTVTFHAPSAFGWGLGKAGLGHEYLKARCLQQFSPQAHDLLEHIRDCGKATAVLVEFLGDWGPETEHFRRGIATTCVHYWKARVQADQAFHALAPESCACLA